MEGIEEVHMYVKDPGKRGARCADVGDLLQGGSSTSSPLWF